MEFLFECLTRVEHEKRNFMSTSNPVLFCLPYKYNSPLLTRKVNFIIKWKLSIFALSREKCHYQSHWIRNFQFFFPHFGFPSLLAKFERHCLYAIRIFQCFSSHSPHKARQATLDWEWWKLRRSFIKPGRVARKASDVSAADLGDIKHSWKKKYTIYFHECCCYFSQGFSYKP